MIKRQIKMLWNTAKETCIEHLISYHFIVCLFLCCFITAIMIWLFSYFEDLANLKGTFSFILFPGVIVAIGYLLMMTVSSFSGEIDKQTMDILFALPVSRWVLYFGKVLGIILLIPLLVASQGGMCLFEMGIIIGYLPPVLVSIALQLILAVTLTLIAIISISALVSVVFRKTLYSATAMFLYVMLMILITPALLRWGEPHMMYSINYPVVSLLPYTCFAAATTSVILLNYVDSMLYYLLTIYFTVTMAYGYLVFRRMEL